VLLHANRWTDVKDLQKLVGVHKLQILKPDCVCQE